MANTGKAYATRIEILFCDGSERVVTDSLLKAFSVDGVDYPALTREEYALFSIEDALSRVTAHCAYLSEEYPGFEVDAMIVNAAIMDDLMGCPVSGENLVNIFYQGNIGSFRAGVRTTFPVNMPVSIRLRVSMLAMNMEVDLAEFQLDLSSGEQQVVHTEEYGADSSGSTEYYVSILSISKSYGDPCDYIPGSSISITD